MLLQDSARLLALVWLSSVAHAESAAEGDAVIVPPAACQPSGDKSWTLKREARLAEILKALADLTCERFFVSRPLLDEKLTIDVGSEALSSYELHQRVEGALRARGIVLDVAATSRVRRAADARISSLPPNPHTSSILAEQLAKGIRCSASRCTITRELVNALFANTSELATSARFVPNLKDGKPNGFKLYAIRPGSLFALLGFQNGDTLQSMNGIDLSTPDRALEAYAKLRQADDVKLAIDRRGEKLTLEWVVK